MQQRTVTREMPKLSLRASFEPSTVNAEKRTVDVVWTTGAPVLRGGLFSDPFFEELSLNPKHVRMGRLQSGNAPLLNSHSSHDISDVLGVVDSARLENGRGVATVRFDSGPAGQDAFRRVSEGTLRNISVGYSTYKMQKVDRGNDAIYPTYRAIDWEPAELSLVPINADAGAATRSGVDVTPCEFIQEREMPDPVKPENTNPSPAPAAPALTEEQRAAIVRAETERVLGIQRRGASLGRPQAEIDAAIAAGTPLRKFTDDAVDARAAAPMGDGGPTPLAPKSPPTIMAGEDQREKTVRGMTAWLIARSGQAQLVATAHKARPDLIRAADSDPGEFRGMTLVDCARRCLEAAGVRTAGMARQDIVGQALTMRSPGATTSDFPNILENILYKVLLAQYAITPDTWRTFCKVGSVSDFRVNKRYRMGTFGSLDSLNELGEFKNKSIPDAEKQSLTAATKGNIIAISRQTIINDDMGAFDTLAAMFGRAAALSQEVDVYALLALNAGLGPTMTDGNTLFHASHNNINTSPGAIGAAQIDADRVLMASQKDPSNNEILALRPAILVLPVGLGGVARQINNGQYDFDASNKFQIPNRVGGLFREIVDTPRITGTRRYLFADPGIAPTIELAYVEGQAQPFMDQMQGWRQDGIEWKVRMDYGVAAIDFRGAVTNAGA